MIRSIVVVACLVCLAAVAHGQTPGSDPFAEHLFPPELVMRHSSDLALDERQRSAIKEAVQKAQSRFTDLQFDLQPEAEKMVGLLQARPVDESAVLAQADRIMALERDIKKTHLALLVRIKNELSAVQQQKLAGLRRK
jgi:Spy/CpxP family protein refolding chaperone